MEDIEHRLPFFTQVKMDSSSINAQPMRVSCKRLSEFEDPHKLSRGHLMTPGHGPGDPAYRTARQMGVRTQGMFATDP